MKILVTGMAGFIAARTSELLLEQGHDLVGVDNLNDYYDVRLKQWRLRALAAQAGGDAAATERAGQGESFRAGRLQFVRGDIENKSFVLDLFAGQAFDATLNLAARAGVRYSMENPDVYMTTNLLGTLNVMDGMRAHGCRKIVLASTSSLYAGQPMPFREDLAVNTPISPYAASKKAAEMLAYSYHYLHGLDVSVLRYFTVFGPAGRPDMAPFRFTQWVGAGRPIELYGDGEQSRDFTYVDDIAAGTIAALRPLGYETINLGGGNNPISINAMIRFLELEMGKTATVHHLPVHKADVAATYADIEKARVLLDWKPQVAPYEGFARTVAWHRANAAWLRDIRL
jgi:UDP-glucuronate 4-epimerase